MGFLYRYFVIVAGLALGVLSSGVLTSYSKPPHRFETVEELVQEALSKNAELQYYEATVEDTQGEWRQAGMWGNPELEVQGGYREVRDLVGEELPSDGYTVGVSIRQTFEFPGKATLRKAIASKDVERASLGLQQFRLALAGRVRLLAYQYLVATENARVAVDIRDRSQALIDMMLKRPMAGSKEFLEVRIIEGSLWELRKVSKQFLLAEESTRLELNELLGRPSSLPLRLSESILPPHWEGDREKLMARALERNFHLQLRKVELAKAVNTLDAAFLDKAPDVAMGPFFSQDRAGDEETNAGVAVSFPLPLWNRNEGGIQAAEAKKTQAKALLLQVRREVERKVQRVCWDWELNRALLGNMSLAELGKLETASEIADRQYRLGAVGVQLFLESQRSFLKAQESRGEVLIDLWRNALELQLLTGGKWRVKP